MLHALSTLSDSEQKYLAVAKEAEVIIYFGGLSHADDRESFDHPDMVLPAKQDGMKIGTSAVNIKQTVTFDYK